MLGGVGVPGRKASPAIRSFPSSRIRFLASRSSQSSAFGSGSAASSRRRSWTYFPTVYGLRPSFEQHCVIGLPVEIILSAASRLSSSAYLANGFDMASSLRSSSACILKHRSLWHACPKRRYGSTKHVLLSSYSPSSLGSQGPTAPTTHSGSISINDLSLSET